eukprot:984300-Amphidinium_carterae.1
MQFCSRRLIPLRKMLLEGPALLPPQVREIEFPPHLSRLPVAVQALGKGGVSDRTPVRSFHMRSLWLGLPRSSQGGRLNFSFSRGREPYPRPRF